MTITTCIFDAYGTLYDVDSAARRIAQQPGRGYLQDIWPELSEIWRQKQLQYSWLRAITGDHIDFWTVTQNGLDFAMEKLNLADDAVLREDLLALYWELAPFKEVPMMLATLKAKGFKTGILSNGSPDMLSGAVTSSGMETYLDAVLSVETVGVFKPNARVYELVLDHFGCSADQVLFVTSNGWDASGACGFGFQTAWVNRAGDPVDRLPNTPHHILENLSQIPSLAEDTNATFHNI